MKIIKSIVFLSIAISLLAGCKKNILDVPNLNEPDVVKVYGDGEDIENNASGMFNTIYGGEHYTNGVAPMLAVASDNVSCSWGNFGMRNISYEPRNNGWDNSPSSADKGLTKYLFDKMYSAIGTANLILKVINIGDVVIGEGGVGKDRVMAFSKFTQGLAYGNLALVFDKAFIVDEKVTVEENVESAVPYTEVAEAALKYLDEAIALSSGSFTIPLEWLGTDADYSSSDFKKLCNTLAARILSYTPRNKTDLAAVNWAKVKAYADAGITKDFTIIQDGGVKWYDESSDYLVADGWGITNMYVVHMLDNTQPQHWDDNANFPYPPKSTNPQDHRLVTDFEYVPSNWFQAARGYYHFSSYRNSRYDKMYVDAKGPKPEIMLSENDMLRAEARAYTSDLQGAANIINAGTRKTRGQMIDVAPVLADIVKAIHHERHVEMYTSGMGLQFFEMRKLDLLQKGTPLHFPLPAGTLETFRVPLPFYTFGYLANADGKGTSNGGWR